MGKAARKLVSSRRFAPRVCGRNPVAGLMCVRVHALKVAPCATLRT